VHKNVITQFIHLAKESITDGEEANTYYHEIYEDMLNLLKKGKEVENNYLEQDTTQYPFALNVVNPQKGKYFAPICRIC
jgi:hypothetical protein